MLKARATENHGGLIISGTGEDLEELYCALNILMEKRDGCIEGEVPPSGTNLRISSLCYDIRHAFPLPSPTSSGRNGDSGAMHGPVGEVGKILSFETGKELPFDLSLVEEGREGEGFDEPEELEDLEELEVFEGPEGFDEDYIDAGELDDDFDDVEEVDEVEEQDDLDGAGGADLGGQGEAGVNYEYGDQTGLPFQALCEFPIMWPELIFVCLLLRDYLGSRYDLEYSKTRKGLDWTLEWVTVRRFQIVVLDCLCMYAGPSQAKSIRKIFTESYPNMGGYCTQYVDKLSCSYASKNAAQRLKLLPQLPRKITLLGTEYRSLEAKVRKTAREYGCPLWEISLVEEIPEDFVW